MFRFRFSWSLPLLAKELLEQSARFRTYAVRMSFVFALCGIALLVLEERSNALNPLALLGSGDTILKSLVYVQFGGIYLLLPAMACGVFTVEKELNTLGLLFLTRLGPWTIVFEKLMSRLLPMACLLLCSLPVFALANSLGGINGTDLFCAIWFVSISAFQVACVAVMCSAFAHSTTAAFLQTYAVLLGLTFGIALIDQMLHFESLPSFFSYAVQSLSNPLTTVKRTGEPTKFYFALSPPHLYMVVKNTDPTTFPAGGPVFVSIASSTNAFLWSIACLGVARFCLYRRAAAKWWNPLMALIRVFEQTNPGTKRGGTEYKDRHHEMRTLPDTQPVGWRETSRGVFGTTRGVIYLLIFLELPVLGVAQFLVSNYFRGSLNDDLHLAKAVVLVLWGVSFFVMLATGATIFPRERSQQTLEVLLTTPIPGNDLILQKLHGVRRMQIVCAIPLLTAILIGCIWREALARFARSLDPNTNPILQYTNMIDGYYWWEYLFGAVTSVWLFSEAFKWIAVWSGLMFRSAIRALVAAMSGLIAYCGIPFMMLIWVEGHRDWFGSGTRSIKWEYIALISTSPVLFLIGNEGIARIRFVSEYPMVMAIGNLIVQGTFILLLRRHILKHAEWYLGRGPFWKPLNDPQSAEIVSHQQSPSRSSVSKPAGGHTSESTPRPSES
jgi:ABC-type transport system involved in multi-copper enzyme maturation permease subunit